MAEPVSRDQILRCEREQGNVHFPCSADHEQPYSVDPYSAIYDDHTYHHRIAVLLVREDHERAVTDPRGCLPEKHVAVSGQEREIKSTNNGD